MIKSVIIVNNQGKPRLTRFYVDTPLDVQKQILKTVHGIVSKRSDDLCCCFAHDPDDPSFKIVYRHYATLYFIFLIDDAESELGVLDLLQVFVQVLDTCFENVCELDLIYHFDRVNYILDEIVMAGMVLETSIDSILAAVADAKKLENEENTVFGFEIPAALRPLGT
ncbi:unnamed protein product [Amoebophrya sp. A120]|nr:unnamed protein product [Amoebophrya sp. A120]|eukprot:GSA120T00009317001.1